MNARRLVDYPAVPQWRHAASLDRGLPDRLCGLVIDEGVADAMAEVAHEVHLARRSLEVGFALWGTPAREHEHAEVHDVQPLDTRSTVGSVVIEPDAFVAAVAALSARSERPGEVIGVVHTHPGDAVPARSFTDRAWHSRLLDDHARRSLGLELPLETSHGLRRFPAQAFYSVVLNEEAAVDRASAYLLLRVRDGRAFQDFEFEIPLYLATGGSVYDRPQFAAQVTEAEGWSYDLRFIAGGERPPARGGTLH